MLRKFTILIAFLFGSAFSKMYFECDSNGQFKCGQEQTCCRSKLSSYGWSCFPGRQGVCCSDGASYCPTGTVCDVPNKTCRKPTLTFLEEATEPMSAPLVTLTPGDLADFGLGLLRGVEIFDGPMNNSTCFKNSTALTNVTNDVARIIEVVRNITPENVVQNLRLVLELYQTLLNDAQPVAQSCTETFNAFQAVLLKVRDVVNQPDYVSELATHTVFNLNALTVLGTGALQSLQQGNYTQAGSLVGQAVKLGFLWKL